VSDMSMNGAAPTTASYDTAAQVTAMLNAMTRLANQAAMVESMQEAKDAAAAVLSFSQAIVVLDPALNQAGVPLEHEMALKREEIEGAKVLESLKESRAAQAPSPAKQT
jgi:type VI protein secretion system component VasF